MQLAMSCSGWSLLSGYPSEADEQLITLCDAHCGPKKYFFLAIHACMQRVCGYALEVGVGVYTWDRRVWQQYIRV
jgi:hypothetical protein